MYQKKSVWWELHKVTETIFGNNLSKEYFSEEWSVWLMSHPLKWRRRDLWPILQPASRGWLHLWGALRSPIFMLQPQSPQTLPPTDIKISTWQSGIFCAVGGSGDVLSIFSLCGGHRMLTGIVVKRIITESWDRKDPLHSWAFTVWMLASIYEHYKTSQKLQPSADCGASNSNVT